MRKSKKIPNETRIYDSIQMFLENYDIGGNFFSERMKYLEENETIYDKQTRNENSFYIWKKDQETVSSPIDQTPVINSPNNSVLTLMTSKTIFS